MARIHSMTIEAPITKVMCNCCWLLSVVLYWNTMAQGSNRASRLRSKAVLASSATSSPLLPVHWWSSKKQMLWTEFSQGCVAECPPCGQPTAWSFWRILACVEEETGVPPSYLRIINCLLKPFRDLSKISSSIKWQRQMEEGYAESIQSHFGAVHWTGKY